MKNKKSEKAFLFTPTHNNRILMQKNKILLFIIITFLISCSSNEKKTEDNNKIINELKAKYNILEETNSIITGYGSYSFEIQSSLSKIKTPVVIKTFIEDIIIEGNEYYIICLSDNIYKLKASSSIIQTILENKKRNFAQYSIVFTVVNVKPQVSYVDYYETYYLGFSSDKFIEGECIELRLDNSFF